MKPAAIDLDHEGRAFVVVVGEAVVEGEVFGLPDFAAQRCAVCASG
jgi:hypothetical protein